MNRKIAVVIAVAIGLEVIISPQSSSADKRHEAMKKEIIAQYKRYDAAIQNKDIKSFSNMLATNYISKTYDGKVFNRTGELQGFRKMTQMMSSIKAKSELKNITINGTRINTVVNTRVSSIIKDPRGRTHQYVYYSTEHHDWNKASNGWKLLKVMVVNRKITMNGQRVPY